MRFLLVFAIVFLEAVYFPALGAEHLSALPAVVRPCAVCHGANGISKDGFIPNIAGQKVEYLVKQTLEMQSAVRQRYGLEPAGKDAGPSRLTDRRDGVHMDRQFAEFDRVSIRTIARYFSSLPRACAPSGTPRGNPSAHLVSHCATCHGRDGASDFSYVPHLAGQRRFYLAEQMRLFRTNEHKVSLSPDNTSRSNPVMSPQMALISKEQIAELAHWFANSPCAEKK